MRKKIFLSFLSGLVIFIITWFYQSSNFSFYIEDAFFRKTFFWKYKILGSKPENKREFVFLNTGKDLAIVDDTTEYGSVAVSDREKMYEIIRILNTEPEKPLFVVIDIQFYLPYSINRQVDTLLQAEINRSDRILIPILKDAKGKYKKPLYQAPYAYSGYETFGFGFNKFQIWDKGEIHSIPVTLNEKLDSSVYKQQNFFMTNDGHLSLTAIWPSFFLIDADVKENKTDITQSYNLGEVLIALKANPSDYSKIFKNKIVIIGNFADDIHYTPVGSMSGPVLLANIYLSLLNKQHWVSYIFLVIMLIAFSGLSYLAWFSKIPDIKFKFKFIFSPDVIKFIRGYLSYFGSMFLLSLVALLFNMYLALFLPSFIFAGIEYFRQKKYLPPKEPPVETPKETPKETAVETPKETPVETAVELTKETPKESLETPKETAVEAAVETPKETPKETLETPKET